MGNGPRAGATAKRQRRSARGVSAGNTSGTEPRRSDGGDRPGGSLRGRLGAFEGGASSAYERGRVAAVVSSLRALPAVSIWRARPSPLRKLQRGFPWCGDGDSCREADPEHSAPCRGSGKPSTLRNCSRACKRMSPVYEAEVCFWFRARPCSDRRRRRFFWFRVWGFGLRLGLWKSGKRIMQAERSGSEAEAEHHPLRTFEGLDPRRLGSCSGGFLVAGVLSFTREERLLREIPRCGDIDERGEAAAGLSSLRALPLASI